MKASEILKEWIDKQDKDLQSILEEAIEYDYVRDPNMGAWEDFTLIFKVENKHIAVDITKWHDDATEKYHRKFFEKLELAYFVEPYQELVTYYKPC
jgi:hypothetical protein